MSKILKYLILSFIFVISFISCQKQGAVIKNTEKISQNNKKQISVSIPPLKWITEKIAGDEFTVISVVSSDMNPELFDPSVKTIEELENSDLYFSFDLFSFEHKLENAVSNSKKIYNVLENNHYLIKSTEQPDDSHSHGEYDPHVWFSMDIDESMAENIKNVLVQKFPEKKEVFEKNYIDFITELENYKADIKKSLESKTNKVFIIYHPALTYFSKEYNLTQISVELEGKEPTARHLKNLINEIKKNNVKLILVQPQFPKSSVDIISKEVPDIKIIEFNPLEENIFRNLKKLIDSLE